MSAFVPSEDFIPIRALDLSDPLNLRVVIEKHARKHVDPSEDERRSTIYPFHPDCQFDFT